MTPCLADETIAAWAADALSSDERERAIEHAASCAICRALVGHLVGAPLTIALQIGRFEIRGPLGAGGMGVVMRGFDPVLGREVALKMIKSTLVDPAHRERMLREAQAMAKVRHGSVVTVHELGEAADEIYVAMELVEGTMLHRWLESPHSLAQRIAVVLGVGRGIAAVHAAGLLHRDIKPDNIIVREDGAPVLVDFGLARASTVPAFGAGSGVAGTPRYLAPEVAAGQPASTASDQFQWWTIVEETLAGLRGRRARAVARLCAHGHDRDPARRFATMHDAVAALERALVTTRRTWFAAAGALIGVALLAFVLLSRSSTPGTTCEPKPARGWSPARRIAVELSLKRAGLDPAPVLAALDARAAATIDLRHRACLAGDRARAEWTRRLVCIDETWAKTAQRIASIGVDAERTREAADELGEVPPTARCARGSLPAVPEELPPAEHARNIALDGEVRRLELDTKLLATARLAKLRALGPTIAAAHYAPLDGRWHWAIGHALHDLGDVTSAAKEYELAAQAGLAAGDDNFYVRALIIEIHVTSSDDKFAVLEAQAEGGARRLDNPNVDADLASARAMHYMAIADQATARKLLEQSDALYAKFEVAPMKMHVAVLENLGAACLEAGDFKAGERALRRAVAVARGRFTEQGAMYWEARGALATALLYANELPSAEAELRATVAGLERTNPDGTQVGQLRAYLCVAALVKHDLPGARRECAASVASITERGGDGTPRIVWPLTLSGQVELKDGQIAKALAFLERAMAVVRRGDARTMEALTAQTYFAIALAKAHRTAEARVLATKIAPALRNPPLAEAHADFARAFPDLR